MDLSGAKAVIKSLEYEHVDTIFGIPGGVMIPIYDELYQQDAITHPRAPRTGGSPRG